MQLIFQLLLLMLSIWASTLFAQPLTPEAVPEPLKPWVNWVLKDDPERLCPFHYAQYEQKYCSWPGQLALSLTNSQGNFNGFWQVEHDSWVILPGDEHFWPQQVTLNTLPGNNPQPALVMARDNLPALFLKPGRYEIEGQFNWDFIPEQLRIPDETGLIKLSINNTPITVPTLKNGLLWIKDSERGGGTDIKTADKLDIQVFRQVTDEVPLTVLTQIELEVAGKAREVTLSQALLSGFTPMALNSPLPSRLEANGQVLLQVRPGHWQVTLLARQTTPSDKLSLQVAPNWPAAEIWVLAAKPALRVVEVIDLPAIDPSQTNLPAEWRSLPAYRITAGQAMNFKVLRRGNPDPEPNQLTLNRQLWLDFDGLGYTINDHLRGVMTRDWRLNALPETLLGKVSFNGQNQLITHTTTGEVGVEVRQGALDVQADSRYQGAISDLGVTGWQQTFQQVNAEINLPPGWRLLAASGVDNVPDSWLSRWTLLDIFMVLIAALSVAQLWNIRWGILALLTFVLIWHEPAAPHYSWLNLLVATALIKLAPPKTTDTGEPLAGNSRGKLATLLLVYQRLCQLAVCLLAIPFLLMEVRTGLYPQLEMPWQPIQATNNIVNTQGLVAPAASPAANMPEAMDTSMHMRSIPFGKSKPEFDYYTRLPQDAANRKASGNTSAYEHLDPQANVQTGPGLPQWGWRKVRLAWNGSVDSQQRVKLWYLSPTVTGVLNFVRVLLVIVLALLLFGILPKPRDPAPKGGMPSAGLAGGLGLWLILFLGAPVQPAKAEFPPQAVLDELKTRLLTPPDCLPACAQIAQLQIVINPTALRLSLQVDAQEAVAVPLPAQQRQWLPEQVILDGDTKAPLLRDAEGQLWVQVKKGRHQIMLQGATPNQDKFSLTLPLKPHRVTVTQAGWEQTGVHEHGQSDPQLQFSRVETSATLGTAAIAPTALPPFFRIERTLTLGLDWHVDTRVIRLTPADAPALLSVPLLPGEAILNAGMRVDKQQVLLNIDATQTEVAWRSVLEKRASLDLQAANTQQWTELWRVSISPLWHLHSEGIDPIYPGQPDTWQPEWRPWPGEQLHLQLTRPETINGQTLTLEHSQLTVEPGKRITQNTLWLKLQSSKGGQHTLTLPAAAELQTVKIDNVLQPVRQQDRTVTLPIKPGTQEWQLVWQQKQAFTSRFHTPEINVGLPSVNYHLKLLPGQDRWILLAFEPRLGPAVLFWGYLLMIALLAYGLSKPALTPLKAWQWLLLLLGLSQISVEQGLLVVGWFWLLAWRRQQTNSKPFSFNALQVLIVIITLMAGGCLFLAVENGLLGTPDMQISGNQSTATDLNWYQDRVDAILPVASVWSVPLLVYRGLMLLWSLWLATSVLQWLKWGWQNFSYTGLWRRKPTPAKPAPDSTLK